MFTAKKDNPRERLRREDFLSSPPLCLSLVLARLSGPEKEKLSSAEDKATWWPWWLLPWDSPLLWHWWATERASPLSCWGDWATLLGTTLTTIRCQCPARERLSRLWFKRNEYAPCNVRLCTEASPTWQQGSCAKRAKALHWSQRACCFLTCHNRTEQNKKKKKKRGKNPVTEEVWEVLPVAEKAAVSESYIFIPSIRQASFLMLT